MINELERIWMEAVMVSLKELYRQHLSIPYISVEPVGKCRRLSGSSCFVPQWLSSLVSIKYVGLLLPLLV
jgi:hypothetical protein